MTKSLGNRKRTSSVRNKGMRKNLLRSLIMSYETLNKWRFLVPSFIIIITLNTLSKSSYDELVSITQITITELNILYLGIGGIYYIFNVRNIITKYEWKKVNINIVNYLKDYCIKKQIPDFMNFNEKKYMDVFYNVIDNDKSLSEKAKKVRSNGLALTSSADLFIICFAASIIFLFKFFISNLNFNLTMFFICFIISLIGFLLMKSLTKKHINLSNKQLNFMTNQCGDKLKDAFNK